MSQGELRALVDALRDRSSAVRAEGLRGSSRAYVLARVLGEQEQPALVLTSTLTEARAFAAELTFLSGAGQGPNALPWDPRVVLYPSWENSPFEAIPPLADISARRVAALARVRRGGSVVCVAPLAAALHRTVPPEALEAATLVLSEQAEAPRDDTARRLVQAGYHLVGQVEERGEASLRGGILDIFAPFYEHPLRIELSGDTVESIRFFEPSTQRSVARVRECVVLPAREVLADDAAVEGAAARLRRRCRELGFGLSQTAEYLEAFRASPLSPLRDTFLPYFYDQTACLWDHFPREALLVLDEGEKLRERAREVLDEAAGAHRRSLAKSSPVPALDEVYITEAQWLERCDAAGRLDIRRASARNDSSGTPMSRATIFVPWLMCQCGM